MLPGFQREPLPGDQAPVRLAHSCVVYPAILGHTASPQSRRSQSITQLKFWCQRAGIQKTWYMVHPLALVLWPASFEPGDCSTCRNTVCSSSPGWARVNLPVNFPREVMCNEHKQEARHRHCFQLRNQFRL